MWLNQGERPSTLSAGKSAVILQGGHFQVTKVEFQVRISGPLSEAGAAPGLGKVVLLRAIGGTLGHKRNRNQGQVQNRTVCRKATAW